MLRKRNLSKTGRSSPERGTGIRMWGRASWSLFSLNEWSKVTRKRAALQHRLHQDSLFFQPGTRTAEGKRPGQETARAPGQTLTAQPSCSSPWSTWASHLGLIGGSAKAGDGTQSPFASPGWGGGRCPLYPMGRNHQEVRAPGWRTGPQTSCSQPHGPPLPPASSKRRAG